MTLLHLDELAREQATYVVDVSFTDEAGAPVTPTAAAWTLTDDRGIVVNGRDAVAITGLAATVSVLLSGDDLALDSVLYNGVRRELLVEYTYDSDLGSGLPGKDALTFDIQPLAGVV
jgi:hypothetical protein